MIYPRKIQGRQLYEKMYYKDRRVLEKIDSETSVEKSKTVSSGKKTNEKIHEKLIINRLLKFPIRNGQSIIIFYTTFIILSPAK